MFDSPFSSSLIKKAQEKGIINIKIVNLRDFTEDKHKTADDSPYGGGAGMVMKAEPLFKAIKSIFENRESRIDIGNNGRVILACPTGKRLNHQLAKELSEEENLIIICGHYEGIDERIRANVVTDEISIGDYVLTGGELPAMVLIDSVVRLLPGVVKEEDSLINDSFYNSLLDYPSFTRPEIFNGESIPEVLKSGHHEEISRWRRKKSLEKTFFRRPDLLATANLTEEDSKLLEEIVNKEDLNQTARFTRRFGR